MIGNEMQLIKYRDAGMHTHTYFWINDNRQTISPYFDSDVEAHEWLNARLNGVNQVSVSENE